MHARLLVKTFVTATRIMMGSRASWEDLGAGWDGLVARWVGLGVGWEGLGASSEGLRAN